MGKEIEKKRERQVVLDERERGGRGRETTRRERWRERDGREQREGGRVRGKDREKCRQREEREGEKDGERERGWRGRRRETDRTRRE